MEDPVNAGVTRLCHARLVFKLRLIPKEEKFFDDFVALADRIVSGATLLERMLSSDPPAWGNPRSCWM